MSTTSTNRPTEAPPVVQEPDRIALRSILAIAAVSLLVVAVSTWIARVLAGPIARTPTQAAPEAIDGVLQTPIATSDTAARARERAQEELASYGWVDRQHGIGHIPIDVAKDLVVASEGAP